MSGWDVPSTPSWAPQDGPDETEAFAAAREDARDHGTQDFAARQDGDRPGPGGSRTAGSLPAAPGHEAGGPPPEFFGDQAAPEPGSGGYPRRVPGQSLQGLPRREAGDAFGGGRTGGFGPAGAPEGGPAGNPDELASRPPAFGQGGAFGQSGAFGQGGAFGSARAFGRDDPFDRDNGPVPGPDSGFGQDRGSGPDNGFGPGGAAGHDDRRWGDEPRRGDGPGRDNGFGQDDPFGAGNPFGGDNGPGRDDPFTRDNGPGRDDPLARDADFGRGRGFGPDNGQRRDGVPGEDDGFGRDDAFGQDSVYGLGWGGSGRRERPEARRGDDWPGAGREPGDDWGPGPDRPGASWDDRPQPDPDAAYRDQAGLGGGGQDYRQPPVNGHEYRRLVPDQDLSQPGVNGRDYPDQGFGDQGAPGQRPAGLQDRGRGDGEPGVARMDPALQDFFAGDRDAAPGYQDPWGASGPATFPARRYRESGDGWGASNTPGSPRPEAGLPSSRGGGGSGPRPGAGGPRGDQGRRGLGVRGLIAIGAVVVVIIVVAVVVFTRSNGSPTGNTSTTAPTVTASSKASGSAAGGGAAAGTAYVLSTPASAGGYAKGKDPNFLAIATSTAEQVSSAVTTGKAGTVKGSPLAAAYELPVGGQVVTFVGYQGTFTPAKVATVLASLGSDPHTYPAGPHGGVLGCANAPATATVTSGAVCVWASSTTLGVTEFFSATGPEALTASQDKGATDTVNMRADVEAPAK